MAEDLRAVLGRLLRRAAASLDQLSLVFFLSLSLSHSLSPSLTQSIFSFSIIRFIPIPCSSCISFFALCLLSHCLSLSICLSLSPLSFDPLPSLCSLTLFLSILNNLSLNALASDSLTFEFCNLCRS